MTTSWLEQIQYNSQGLVPVITQDVSSGAILMFAWMNKESLLLTWQRKQAVYWSRSRNKLWHKGEESGHFQHIKEIRLDCDNDVIMLQVMQVGGVACHTGRPSCFYHTLTAEGWQITESVAAATAVGVAPGLVQPAEDTLSALCAVLETRKSASADSSYVASLYHKGLNKILEKIGEEATETIIAAKEADLSRDKIQDMVYETADLWFHTLVMLAHFGVDASAVTNELARRFDLSGLAEKAARRT